MTPYLLALAMFAQPNATVGKKQLHSVARAILPAAKVYKIDPVLIGALVLIESGGRNIVVYKRGKKRKGADVGVFQIHCPEASVKCIDKHNNLNRAAYRSAKILSLGRKICNRPPNGYKRVCGRGWTARYNPGSARWQIRLSKQYEQLKIWISNYKQRNLLSLRSESHGF